MEDVETIATGVFRLRILFCNEEILVEKLGDSYGSRDKWEIKIWTEQKCGVKIFNYDIF